MSYFLPIILPIGRLTAQDDPFVPFASFSAAALAKNPYVTLIVPEHGGHCAFVSRYSGDARFCAEAMVMEFCCQLSAAAFGREEIEEQHRK
jgi:predicted alpha/beta-fold hydrolase